MKNEGYDVYNIDVIYRAPGVDGKRLEELTKYFINEIYDFAKWLNGSKGIDEDRLLLEIKRKNRLLTKVKKILELRIKHPFHIRSLATMYIMTGLNNYFGRPKEYEEVVDGLLNELEGLEESPLENVVPIVWAGGTGQEFGIYESIDNANGALLGFIGTPYRFYDEEIPPVESLAKFLLGGPAAGASIYGREVIEQQIKKVNAKGLILYGYLGCSFGSVQREMYRDYFHKQGIPSINLEGSFQVGSPSGQVLTRVKAFIEMLS
jgi:benzoyl-CoA reductase/2-hydroxyglutaryl-CoA dehydratase subunit BcrC/BadD/HgdB